MSAERSTTNSPHRRFLISIGLLLTLVGVLATIRVSTTEAAALHYTAATASCSDAGDVFELDVPGTYTAFASTSTSALPTHVRSSHGEVLATTHPTAHNTIPIDTAAGAQFGITPPPQVFEVTSNVMIHVEGQNAPYELVIVRLGEDGNKGPIAIRPPVERVVNQAGSCLLGDLREYSRVHIDAVYSDPSVRQVFVVESVDVDAKVDASADIDAHVEG